MTAALPTRASSSSEHPGKLPQLQTGGLLGGRGLRQGLHGAITESSPGPRYCIIPLKMTYSRERLSDTQPHP